MDKSLWRFLIFEIQIRGKSSQNSRLSIEIKDRFLLDCFCLKHIFSCQRAEWKAFDYESRAFLVLRIFQCAGENVFSSFIFFILSIFSRLKLFPDSERGAQNRKQGDVQSYNKMDQPVSLAQSFKPFKSFDPRVAAFQVIFNVSDRHNFTESAASRGKREFRCSLSSRAGAF